MDVGPGAARDLDLMAHIARVSAREMSAAGIYWHHAPVVTGQQAVRRGRRSNRGPQAV